MKGTFKDGIIYAIVFWVVTILIGTVIVDKLIMPWLAGHFQPIVVVPNVTGKNADEAKAAMKSAGLQIVIAPERRSSGLPEGLVMQQIPAAGRSVKGGRVVQLILSKGANELTLINLRGASLNEAQERLRQLGLQFSVQYINDPHVAPGSVIRTQPEANSIIPVETIVQIVVAEGITLPNLVGMDLEKARVLLDSLHLDLRSTLTDSTAKGAHNTITWQTPKPGSILRHSEPVALKLAP